MPDLPGRSVANLGVSRMAQALIGGPSNVVEMPQTSMLTVSPQQAISGATGWSSIGNSPVVDFDANRLAQIPHNLKKIFDDTVGFQEGDNFLRMKLPPRTQSKQYVWR